MNTKKGIKVYGYKVYGVWNFPISLYLISPIPICTNLSLSKYNNPKITKFYIKTSNLCTKIEQTLFAVYYFSTQAC